MNREIIFPILLCFFFFSCGNNNKTVKKVQTKDTVTVRKPSEIKSGLVFGTEIVMQQKMSAVYAMGRIGDTLIYCSKKGIIEIADTNQKFRRQIVDLKVGILVDEIFVIPHPENKWFFVWQETYQEGIRTYAALYKAESLKPEWKIMFPVPNPGRPVVDGEAAYISALGVVGKISLDDGSFIWKHDSLFNQKKFSFQQIEKALVYTDKVVFVDYPKPGFREVRDSLFLDPITGVRKK
ncbi:MAG: hypothetical protein NT084_14240 [Bacteroidetes bacterium]|nr:hypothetical protein [Bacteroidota bacterium]